MALTPPRRVRLGEGVAEQIMAFVREQGLRAGDPLPTETELMERMRVGRSSVREALRGLAVLGLIEIRQGYGTFVRDTSPQVGPDGMGTGLISAALARGITAELLEAREIIEIRIAALAARRATPQDLANLLTLLRNAEALGGRGRDAFQLSANFHLALARATHNDVLAGFVASYVHLLLERGTILRNLPGYHEWELGEHERIYEAVAAHDSRLASRRMRAHLQGMRTHFAHLAATPAASLLKT